MPKQTAQPEKTMTRDEAAALAALVADRIDGEPERLAAFLLLLRWMSYSATRNAAEDVYMETKQKAMPFLPAAERAVREELAHTLDTLRRRTKGGKP